MATGRKRDSTLTAHSAYLSSRELVTIVGNLVENAFEAVKAAPLKQVGLFIGEDDRMVAAINAQFAEKTPGMQVDYSTGGRPRVEYRSK